ncbi:hypothetical protein BJ878DRAFT_210100 [Calycina marina]|uniref:C2H2-type domain-containing protein n=1 Tax=Calycina marina TaxID=1763456 RepID=A0A9P7Z961_9HELO|nr:hypothetical protein BJ878DRAFT_210100 [Calycina marina]
MANQHFHMIPRHLNSAETDFPLYPDPTTSMFPQQPFPFAPVQNFEMEQNWSYNREAYSVGNGFDSHPIYAENPQYGNESPKIRTAPSNYSTASGTSATSSNIGSPHSVHQNVPEWGPNGIDMTPSIVSYDNSFSQGTEYSFAPTGMEEFATLEYSQPKSVFSVGKCNNATRSRQHGPASSNVESVSSISTFPATPTTGSMSSPSTTRSPVNMRSGNTRMGSSVSPISSRPPLQAFSTAHFIPSSTAGSVQDCLLTPLSAVSNSSFASESTVFPNYHALPFFSQSSGNFVAPLESYPSILHGQYAGRPASSTQSNDTGYQPTAYAGSPLSQQSRSPHPIKAGSQSPYLNYKSYPYPPPRRPSVVSFSSDNFSSEESREKGRCTYPDCGKVFKDLKAHMLTHQHERPEKCPIQTCDYHIKGFARKYDKNRHTLTHYKGTMVCGFCPGSGSSAEKSFNRADVFKRHLTSVHAVEQTPPNSRKKTSSIINSTKKLAGYAPDATGKCSTCSSTFGNAQDFYEHLDDCVLRIVQQEEPSEAINSARLAEVESDSNVHDTLRNNQLPTTTQIYPTGDDEDDEENDDDNDDDFSLRTKSRKGRGNPKNGVQKSRCLTYSKGGVTLHNKSRKRRKDYPSSWGCPTTQMKMKKRVLCIFDGPRRLWKDDMMLDTDYEVRMKLTQNEKAYVTDLDVQTMRRADAFHNSTEEEKGPWVSDDLTGLDLEKLMEVKREQ